MAQPARGQSAGAARPGAANWRLKGDGVVCCPCRVPCPCRTNAKPSYGHCEATLYLRIKQGHYQDVNLDNMNFVGSEGMCAVAYQPLSALYFSSSDSPERRAAFIALLSSFAETPSRARHVEVVSLNAQVTDEHLFKVSIPGILEIVADRNWGLSAPPMPMVAAPDHFANQLQYVQNIRYSIHDPEAGLDFDYSRRQANYRVVDLSDEQYRTKSMLIQFSDYSGWYSPGQMALIKAQHLQIPDLAALREQASRLRGARGSQ
jgi:hypothetical protein